MLKIIDINAILIWQLAIVNATIFVVLNLYLRRGDLSDSSEWYSFLYCVVSQNTIKETIANKSGLLLYLISVVKLPMKKGG